MKPGVAESGAAIVIAIGHSAAQAAMTWSTLPVVYCQVFNFKPGKGVRVPVKGVAAIPPLSLQVQEWLKADPELRRIGAILGDGHESLIAEAEAATAMNELAFQYQVAASDRETLYMFNRMAPDIDGFWLFPDNRVLSIAILKEMLSYAGRHQVQIAAFNPALLQLGAHLSVGTVDADIAKTALAVADRIINGELEAIPARTPLHQIDVRAASATAAKGIP